MENNFCIGCFHFLYTKKLIFHFSGGKNEFFCEATTKVHHDNWINPISKNIREQLTNRTSLASGLRSVMFGAAK
jgi:hypothetical protein